jgi:hypothetical protein
MNAQLKRERQLLIQHLLAQDWDCFGTLKFVNGRAIGSNTAKLVLRSYWNKIDRMFFGKAAQRQNIRVPRWCFAHEGADCENFHVHFVLLSPLPDLPYVCALLNAVWAAHHPQTAPLDKNWIMPAQSKPAVASYLTHEYWRLGSATLLDEITWSQTAAAQMAGFAHSAQASRIAAVATYDAVEAAKAAFLRYRDKYKQINDHLHSKRGDAP